MNEIEKQIEEKLKIFERNDISALSKEFDEEAKIYFSEYCTGLLFLRKILSAAPGSKIKSRIYSNKRCKEWFRKYGDRITYLLLENIPDDKWSEWVLSDEELENYMLLTRAFSDALAFTPPQPIK